MNIISNTCVGAALQRDCIKQEYANPFCWCTIDFNSMYYLIKNYDKINFDDFNLIKNENWRFSIVIENKIQINYPHYKLGKTDKTLRRKGEDIFYYKMWEYVVQKYEERKNRMIKNKEKPIFIIATIHKCQTYNKNQIKELCTLCSKKGYKLIISNLNMDFSKEFPLVKFIKTTHTEKEMNNVGFAKTIYKEIDKFIKG